MDFVALCERGPGPRQAPLVEFLRTVFAERTMDEWVEWFRGRDICFAPVKTLREGVDDEHARARGMVIVDDAGREHVGPAIKFREEPARPSLTVPRLGEHTEQILGALRQGRQQDR